MQDSKRFFSSRANIRELASKKIGSSQNTTTAVRLLSSKVNTKKADDDFERGALVQVTESDVQHLTPLLQSRFC